MNIGEKLRHLRSERKFTQPELAEAIGIEQSYLSKLETGKSVPSGDVFAQVLEVFDTSVGEFVDDLDHNSRLQLRKIPLVAAYFAKQRELIIGSRRRWLLIACLSLAAGIACFYGGFAKTFVPDTVYQYRSHGVVLEGESKEVFVYEIPNGWRFPNNPGGYARNEIVARLDEDFVSTREFRGRVFNVPVDGGSRTYILYDQAIVDSWVNKAAAAIGLFLASMGLVLLFLERKLARYQ